MSRQTTTLSTRYFFDGTELHDNVSLTLNGEGVIEKISSGATRPAHFLVSTGLVDIQMNGFDRHDVADLDQASAAALGLQLRTRGTLTWLGTLVSAPLSVMSSRLVRLSDLLSTNSTRQPHGCAGIHLEGPFLGSATGAHNSEHIIAADVEWIQNLPPTVRVMTIAPDNPACTDAIRVLTQRGVAVSLGHSRPTRQQYENAVEAGARIVTHLFNAMSGVHHRDGGLASWALVDDRLAKGLIADGVHVSDDAGILAGRAIPADQRFLVSDSIAWNGQWATRGGVTLTDGAPRLADGTLAGSSASLSDCVRNAVQRWKWPLREALRSATCVPARVAGIEAPRATVGQSAFLVSWDESLHVAAIVSQ